MGLIWFLFGGALLLALIWALKAFERAPVSNVKSLGAWIAALGGLTLAVLMVLTGRGWMALNGLLLFGPLLYQRWRGGRIGTPPPGASGGANAGGWRDTFRPRSSASMTRDEAYDVLGLKPGATEADIRAAHRRLMRGAHPDGGGSDWLASRVNQARDVLLGSSKKA